MIDVVDVIDDDDVACCSPVLYTSWLLGGVLAECVSTARAVGSTGA